jgi:sigma-E factor negative regulatory protein RseC
MESVIGKVSSVRDCVATIVVESPIGCHRCASGKGCGAGLLTGTEKQRQIEIIVPSGMNLHVGSGVRLAVAPRDLLRAASIAYGLPLVTMLAFIGLAWAWLGALDDLPAMLVAAVGLLAGLVAGRQLLKTEAACRHLVPVIDGLVDLGDD